MKRLMAFLENKVCLNHLSRKMPSSFVEKSVFHGLSYLCYEKNAFHSHCSTMICSYQYQTFPLSEAMSPSIGSPARIIARRGPGNGQSAGFLDISTKSQFTRLAPFPPDRRAGWIWEMVRCKGRCYMSRDLQRGSTGSYSECFCQDPVIHQW